MCKPRLIGLGLIMLLAMILVVGCLTDPENKETPTEEPAEFRDLTAKEDVIYNLLLSYEEINIDEYSRLLLEPDDTYNGSTYADGYYWYNQPGIFGLDEFLLRDDDIAATNNIFLAAKGTPAKPGHPVLDDLKLEITNGLWTPVAVLFEESCEDCWYTERGYNIKLFYGANSIEGMHNVQFYIVPVDEGGKKIYRIAVAKDVLTN